MQSTVVRYGKINATSCMSPPAILGKLNYEKVKIRVYKLPKEKNFRKFNLFFKISLTKQTSLKGSSIYVKILSILPKLKNTPRATKKLNHEIIAIYFILYYYSYYPHIHLQNL